MTLHFHSPKSRRLVFVLFILISLVFSGTVFSDTAYGKKKRSSGRSARAQKGKKATARNRSTSRRGRHVGEKFTPPWRVDFLLAMFVVKEHWSRANNPLR